MSILSAGNFQWVLSSTVLLGMASGLIGCLAYWKRQSLMSDALSHAALPGVVIAFMLMQDKQLFGLVLGAAASALLGAWLIQAIPAATRIHEDTAMGMILAVFFGGGMMLLSIVNRSGFGNQAGLDQFIFGQAAVMVRKDVILTSMLALAAILVVFIAFKEWKLLLFDPGFARGLGFATGWMNALYVSVLVLTIVIGIQAVGVILMSALLIIPPVSARYWTNRFRTMVLLSALFGGIASAAGTTVSALGSGWPTGPFIVVGAAAFFLVSLFFGREKGLAVEYWSRLQQRKAVETEETP